MLTFIQERNNALFDCFRREIGDTCYVSPAELRRIAEKVANGPAPCYYTTYMTAYRMISRLRAGNLNTVEGGRRSQMWREILDKCYKKISRQPEMTLSHALVRVLNCEEASSFFISPLRALAIYHEELRHRTHPLQPNA